MADLMYPILIIILMFIILDNLESGLLLLMIGLLFLPIAWLFSYAVGDYDKLFTVSISAYTSNIVYKTTLSGIMFGVPLFSFLKIWYMRYLMSRGDIPKTMVSEGGGN